MLPASLKTELSQEQLSVGSDLLAQEVPAGFEEEQVQELLQEQSEPELLPDNPGSPTHVDEQAEFAAKVEVAALAQSCAQADNMEKADPPADHLAEPFLLPLPDSPANFRGEPKANGAHERDAAQAAQEPEDFDAEDGANQDIIHVPPSPARMPQPTKLHILQRGSAPAAPAFRAPPGLEEPGSEEPEKVASAVNSSAAAWLNLDDTDEPESDEEELMLPGPQLFPPDGLDEEPELDLGHDHSAEVLQSEIERQNRVIETLQAKLEEMERACQGIQLQ